MKNNFDFDAVAADIAELQRKYREEQGEESSSMEELTTVADMITAKGGQFVIAPAPKKEGAYVWAFKVGETILRGCSNKAAFLLAKAGKHGSLSIYKLEATDKYPQGGYGCFKQAGSGFDALVAAAKAHKPA